MTPIALAAALMLADLQPEPTRPICLIPVVRCEDTRFDGGITLECTTFMVPCAEAGHVWMART